MEIVLNRCWGGFALSDKAIALCIEKGMTVAEFNNKDCKLANIIKYPIL